MDNSLVDQIKMLVNHGAVFVRCSHVFSAIPLDKFPSYWVLVIDENVIQRN